MKRGPANSCVVHASCNLHVIVLGASLEKGMAIVKHGIHVSSRPTRRSPSPTRPFSAQLKCAGYVLFGIHEEKIKACAISRTLNAEEIID